MRHVVVPPPGWDPNQFTLYLQARPSQVAMHDDGQNAADPQLCVLPSSTILETSVFSAEPSSVLRILNFELGLLTSRRLFGFKSPPVLSIYYGKKEEGSEALGSGKLRDRWARILPFGLQSLTRYPRVYRARQLRYKAQMLGEYPLPSYERRLTHCDLVRFTESR